LSDRPEVTRPPAGAAGPVTTTVTRRVKPGHEASYEGFLEGIIAAAGRFPGYQGVEVFRPSHPGDVYRTVYRFDSVTDLSRWLDSDEHAAWLARAEPHALGPIRTSFLRAWRAGSPSRTNPAPLLRRRTRWRCSPGRRSSR
jgi:antibiotic biosynthesis monooxygenase (ABM) superfamily enzyme